MSQRIEPKEKLEPCPFCGNAPKLSIGKIAPGWFQIECVAGADKCGVYLYTIGQTEEEAAARWNRRVNT